MKSICRTLYALLLSYPLLFLCLRVNADAGSGNSRLETTRSSEDPEALSFELFEAQKYEEALKAAEAAQEKGNRSREMLYIRSLSAMYLSMYKDGFYATGGHNTGFKLGKFTAAEAQRATAALEEFYRESSVPPDKNGFREWLIVSNELVNQSSKMLQSYYYQGMRKTPPDIEAFKGLRAVVRKLIHKNLKMDEKYYSFRRHGHGSKIKGAPFNASSTWRDNPFVLLGMYNGFWHDDPDEWATFLTRFFKEIRKHEDEDYSSTVLYDFDAYLPVLVVWDPDSTGAFRQAYEGFFLKLVSSRNYQDKLDALRLKLSPVIARHIHKGNRMPTSGGWGLTTKQRDQHIGINEEIQSRFYDLDFERVADLILLYCDVIRGGRRQFAAGDLYPGGHYYFIEQLLEALKESPEYGRAVSGYYKLRRDMFEYFLSKGPRLDPDYYIQFHPRSHLYRPLEETERMLQEAGELHPGEQKDFMKDRQKLLDLRSRQPGAPGTDASGEDSPVLYANRRGKNYGVVLGAVPTEDSVMLTHRYYKESTRTYIYNIIHYDTRLTRDGDGFNISQTVSQEAHQRIMSGRGRREDAVEVFDWYYPAPVAVLDGLYYRTKNQSLQIFKDVLGERKVIPSPIKHKEYAQVLDGRIYLFQQGTDLEIAVYDPETQELKAYPFISRNLSYSYILDSVFLDENGQLNVIYLSGNIVRYLPEKKTWEWRRNKKLRPVFSFTDLISIFSLPYQKYTPKKQYLTDFAQQLLDSEAYQSMIPENLSAISPENVLDIYGQGDVLFILYKDLHFRVQVLNLKTKEVSRYMLDVSEGEELRGHEPSLRFVYATPESLALVDSEYYGFYYVKIPVAPAGEDAP